MASWCFNIQYIEALSDNLANVCAARFVINEKGCEIKLA